MRPTMIPGWSRVAGKSQGYIGLPIRDEIQVDTSRAGAGQQVPAMVTAWEPSPAELAALVAGATVRVELLGAVPPPMRVEVGPAPGEDEPPYVLRTAAFGTLAIPAAEGAVSREVLNAVIDVSRSAAKVGESAEVLAQALARLGVAPPLTQEDGQ